MKQRLIQMGIPYEIIQLEEKSIHTAHHALYVSELMIQYKYEYLLIITSGYHLLRTYLTFLREVITLDYPYKVYGYSAGSLRTWFQKTFSDEKQRLRIQVFFNEELYKIKKYQQKNDVATFKEAWQYLKVLQGEYQNGLQI
ncbi:MAG: YdcF family protein [Chloroflexi bacterium]|nr:YdcF family protein [Chloroflexota bacterium]